jgi:tetratricopeptide (TPR) repeat protein
MKITMRLKFTVMAIVALLTVNLGFAQQDEECMNNLSIFDSYAKNKKYDDAYEPWMIVRNKCPKFNRAIYVRGADILEHKIENSTGQEKTNFIKDYLVLLEKHHEYYPTKYKKGKMLGEKAQFSYDYRKELGLSNEQLYKMFDDGFTQDLENFNNPKWLYSYFYEAVQLYDAKKMKPQDFFNKYDDVNDQIEAGISKYSTQLNKLNEKEEAGQTLTKRENSLKRQANSYLTNYDLITGSIDKLLGDRANCEVIIPLYEKDFEEKKNDTQWLQRAIDKLYAKECTDDPLFIKVVEQKNTIAPNADTAYYIGILKEKEGKNAEAEEYFKQAISLESDPLKKARTNKRLGEKFYKRGIYSKSRNYFRQALKLNPSDGSPYLRIAAMYAKSANDCGDTNFTKRAVFWLAADEALKAGRVDPRLRKSAGQYADNYNAKAPSKADVFSSEYQVGDTISIGCWIGSSVKVRN